MSQVGLADKLGVSRQAVSKWESEQFTPDLDKVILLSNLFEVTTDYLLKGTEMELSQKKKINAYIFSAIATMFNFTGLILASFYWYEKQQVVEAVAIGSIFIAIGLMVHAVGFLFVLKRDGKNSK